MQSFGDNAKVTCCLLTLGCDIFRSRKWQVYEAWKVYKQLSPGCDKMVSDNVFLFEALKKKNRNHNTSQCQKCLCSQRYSFPVPFQIMRLWLDEISSIPDCTLRVSYEPLRLSMQLSLFQLTIVFLISWPDLALDIAECC